MTRTTGSGVVTCVPLKRRPRFANGKAYVDKATKADEAAVRAAYDGPLFDGPVCVRVYVFKPLKSAKPDLWHPFVEKPDVDNVAKAVLDGLNGIAYHDDAQVVELRAYKLDRSHGDEPWCMFTVHQVRDQRGRPIHV